MKKYFLISYLFCFAFSLAANNPEYAAFLIPEELKENANAVIRLENTTFDVESLSSGVLRCKYVVTLLNDESDENVLVLPYDKDSRVTMMKAVMYDAFGNKIRTSRKEDFSDYSAVSDFSIYEDDRVKVLSMNHSRYPYTIEFETEQLLKGSMFFSYPDYYIQDYNISVEKSSFAVSYPANSKIYYYSNNFDGTPRESETKSRKRILWQADNLPALKAEPYSASGRMSLPCVYLSPDVFKFDKYSGSMRSWKEFGQFVHSLGKERDILSEEMTTTVRELTKSLPDNKSKIEALYKYLQKNMRYVSVQLGIGGYQPFSAAYVEKNKYGDCKALTNFMKSMLQAANIEAHPALILSGSSPVDYPDDFVLPIFNHVILYVPGEKVWLECTSTDYPINYIGSGNANREVLLITPEGGKMSKTRGLTVADNIENYNAQVKINADGSADINYSVDYQGSLHEYYRYLSNHVSDEEQKKKWLKSTGIPSPKLLSLEINCSETEPEATQNAEVKATRYATKAGTRLFVPANTISSFKNILKKTKERNSPIVRETGYQETSSIVFTLPEGWKVEAMPSAKNLAIEDFGSYDITFEQKENGEIILQRHLVIKPFSVPAEKYEDLRSFYKEISKADNTKFVLVQELRP